MCDSVISCLDQQILVVGSFTSSFLYLVDLQPDMGVKKGASSESQTSSQKNNAIADGTNATETNDAQVTPVAKAKGLASIPENGTGPLDKKATSI